MTEATLSPTVSFDPLDRPSHILDLCHTGAIPSLSRIFSACNITAPATSITIHNSSLFPSLPQTYSLVEAAVRGHQKATVEYLYTVFPRARIQGPELLAAIELGNLGIFELLAKQAQSRYDVVHREFEDGETSLVKACRGQHPGIAFYLLDEGADPNYNGLSGDLAVYTSPLANAVQEQDLELVQALVGAGARVEGWCVESAIQRNRPHVVEFLVNSKHDLNLEAHLAEAAALGHDECVSVLERRITGGRHPREKPRHHSVSQKLHDAKEHILEKVESVHVLSE